MIRCDIMFRLAVLSLCFLWSLFDNNLANASGHVSCKEELLYASLKDKNPRVTRFHPKNFKKWTDKLAKKNPELADGIRENFRFVSYDEFVANLTAVSQDWEKSLGENEQVVAVTYVPEFEGESIFNPESFDASHPDPKSADFFIGKLKTERERWRAVPVIGMNQIKILDLAIQAGLRHIVCFEDAIVSNHDMNIVFERLGYLFEKYPKYDFKLSIVAPYMSDSFQHYITGPMLSIGNVDVQLFSKEKIHVVSEIVDPNTLPMDTEGEYEDVEGGLTIFEHKEPTPESFPETFLNRSVISRDGESWEDTNIPAFITGTPAIYKSDR